MRETPSSLQARARVCPAPTSEKTCAALRTCLRNNCALRQADLEDHTYIHRDEDPFKTKEGLREPGRRFRGRLTAPVTIWTSGVEHERAGLTVGSILFAEGEPSSVIGLINDLTDLYDRILDTERFVVHIAQRPHRVLAERFAG